MVLAKRIGRERPYPLVLLLYVATFGIYGHYWHYKAHHEVYRQFELDLENRTEGLVWLVLDRIFFPLRWVFQYSFVGNVASVRRRLGFRDTLKPGTFLGFSIPGSILLYAAFILLIIANPETVGEDLASVFLLSAAATAAVGAILQIVAFALLQSDLNGLWRAFDGRMRQLFPAPPPPPSPPAGAGWRPAPAGPAPGQAPPGPR